MSDRITCPFCSENIECEKFPSSHYLSANCPNCGKYLLQYTPQIYGIKIRDKISSFLFHRKNYNSKNSTLPFIGSKACHEKHFYSDPEVSFITFDEILAFYPKNIAERVSKTLITLDAMSEFLGQTITLNKKQLSLLFFINPTDSNECDFSDTDIARQISTYSKYLTELDYIKYSNSGTGKYYVELKPQGLQRVDELQKNSTENSKSVFVAMSFAKEMDETRETIRRAITENNLEPRIMDEIEHNHQIVPEMLYEIRQSKFVIAELTGHNNGAYFEAGYALAFGKEVIQVCNKEKFGEDGHFDVKQINTVMWETQEELFERLNARIKATIG